MGMAARGPDGRRYPWGNDWDPKRANVGTEQPAPVGSHPGDVSPFAFSTWPATFASIAGTSTNATTTASRPRRTRYLCGHVDDEHACHPRWRLWAHGVGQPHHQPRLHAPDLHGPVRRVPVRSRRRPSGSAPVDGRCADATHRAASRRYCFYATRLGAHFMAFLISSRMKSANASLSSTNCHILCCSSARSSLGPSGRQPARCTCR